MWQSAWESGRTGFHQDRVHPDLERFAPQWLGERPRRVLVPLCGKTLDLAWLVARGHTTVGVELVPQAVHELHTEQRRAHNRVPVGPYDAWQSAGLTVLQGDIFALEAEHCGAPTHAWDRAALVALPADMRTAYVARLRRVLGPGGRVLLSSFAYDQTEMSGPPFSVTEAEVRRHYAGCTFEKLDEQQMIDKMPGMRARGLSGVVVTTWLIQLPG
jgi:thiopurine S-methyltransferase